MKCHRCGKEINKEQIYTREGRKLCEDCYLHTGLFPLGHTGQYRKIFYIKDRKQSG